MDLVMILYGSMDQFGFGMDFYGFLWMLVLFHF